MAGPEYEYYGLMAGTWDLFRGDTSQWEDRPFFLEIIRNSGQPALDVGCGTGRLLLDYLSQGVDIDGVDISPEMLERCREKARSLKLQPRLFEDNMVTMQLPRHYQTIIVPSSSFQLVLDAEHARLALLNLHSHLLPGGTLVMPFMSLASVQSEQSENRGGSEHSDSAGGGWRKTGEMVRPGDGAIVRRWSISRYDPETQLEHTEDRYEVFMGDVKVSEEHHVRSPAVRAYTQQQAVDFFTRAGFTDIRVYKGFTFDPASAADELYSITGKKG